MDPDAAPAAPSTSAVVPSAGSSLAELKIFDSQCAYVYTVPPASTVGHRAETWNVESWLQEVSVRVVRLASDDAYIRLADSASGELFAECPLTVPLQTCIEPVLDSSRYFVLRIVDRESGHHAFVGLGFRERGDASDFNAALFEHVQHLQRKRQAGEMRAAHEAQQRRRQQQQQQQQQHDGGSDGMEAAFAPAPDASPPTDLSLKPGERMHLRINSGQRAGAFGGFAGGRMTKNFSLMVEGGAGGMEAAFAPARGTPMGLSPAHSAPQAPADWGEFSSAPPLS